MESLNDADSRRPLQHAGLLYIYRDNGQDKEGTLDMDTAAVISISVTQNIIMNPGWRVLAAAGARWEEGRQKKQIGAKKLLPHRDSLLFQPNISCNTNIYLLIVWTVPIRTSLASLVWVAEY